MHQQETINNQISFEDFKQQILNDFYIAHLSRQMSLLGRREVLTGKAKFGIFGAGKELPQLAMARVFKNGDFRSGYYRDQTFMMAIGQTTPRSCFAQLYAITDLEMEPSSAGRQMTSHFSSSLLNADGSWRKLTEQKNSSSDISTTAGQMPRLVGLGQASKFYKKHPEADPKQNFSVNGQEIAFGTIGDASTSEGLFWETINACGVLQIPVIISIWDDEYGISVGQEHQRTKTNLSELLKGFQRNNDERGFEIITTSATNYPHLVESYEKAERFAREQHIPVVVHVQHCTQPQGHSTSGSHERYKSKERLNWEAENDNIELFRKWISNFRAEENGETLILATEEELNEIESKAKASVKEQQKEAWNFYQNQISSLQKEVEEFLKALKNSSSEKEKIEEILQGLINKPSIYKKDIFHAVRSAVWVTRGENSSERNELKQWLKKNLAIQTKNYSAGLYADDFGELPSEVKPSFDESTKTVDGRIILRDNFEKIFSSRDNVLIFGEDTGKIGDVNQGLEGLQEKFGIEKISDTGIREATILGQGIGLAMRGLRPIAEIQYLDYVLYCLQLMSDDLSTLFYRSAGTQKAPVIVRTRGHRLEGIWHAGSPMAGILNLVRGMYVCVPRDMTKAAGFYNTLLDLNSPAIVIESLNGYRLKETMPNNLGEFKTPIGEVEITHRGSDVTLVTYGSTWRIVAKAAEELAQMNISCEVIDVQTLLPLDLSGQIAKSVQKTNRLFIIDEDVPGGASAYILQQILEKDNAYFSLDSQPKTITAKAHRPAYASDGDYFSKPSLDDIVEGVYAVMHESNPTEYPAI